MKTSKILSLIVALAMVMSLCAIGAMADSSLEDGSYDISEYVEISLYVNAMGGIDFGDGMLNGATLTVSGGESSITLALGYSTGVIYTVAFKAYVDPSVEPLSGGVSTLPGYYDAEGNIVYAEYTVSSETCTNPDGEAVNYVDSMTISVAEGTEVVDLWIYVNSNVMGLQFCDGSGSAGSANPGIASKYEGYIAIDWDGILAAYASTTGGTTGGDEEGEAAETSTQTATVTYSYTAPGASNTYEVSIPSTIAIGEDGSASYTVSATSFDLAEGAYVTVSADATGTLTSGSNTLSFTNSLSSAHLTASGDTLTGVVTLTTEATESGDYTGTIDFTINFYTGE